MSISLLDLVTENQDSDDVSLRKVVEERGDSFKLSGSSTPVKLSDDIFLWESKEDIRDPMPEGSYVVIDAMFFSTTTVQLFERGIEEITVFDDHDALRSSDLPLKIGERGDGYVPRKGMDLYNSPSHIEEDYGGGEKAGITSRNGAKALVKLIEATENSDIFVGSSTNASSVAESISGELHLVSAGKEGGHRAEDHIASYLIAKEIQGGLDDSEELMIKRMMEDIVTVMYGEDEPSERRRKDYELLKQLNSRDSVPVYDRESEALVEF